MQLVAVLDRRQPRVGLLRRGARPDMAQHPVLVCLATGVVAQQVQRDRVQPAAL